MNTAITFVVACAVCGFGGFTVGAAWMAHRMMNKMRAEGFIRGN